MDNLIHTKILNMLKSHNGLKNIDGFKLEENINLSVKNGNVNLAIDINPKTNEDLKLYEEIQDQLKKEINDLKNILSVNIVLTSEKKVEENQKNMFNEKYKLESKNIIAIASGKGGVGKSTVAVNLAIALSKLNKSVALLDADIYGPSIPKMMGISNKPSTNENKKMIPLNSYGIKCMSIGFLIPSDTPTIWRGPMIMKALEQLFVNVEWGKTDYMIVDLPPGTGDTQITMAQKVPLKGAIIVSTPQDIALIDARKGINMFKKVKVPVLGIIENMSYFICDKCHERHEIFSYGGAKKESIKFSTNFLGEIPLNKDLRIRSDSGKPIGIDEPDSEISKTYLDIAKKIILTK